MHRLWALCRCYRWASILRIFYRGLEIRQTDRPTRTHRPTDQSTNRPTNQLQYVIDVTVHCLSLSCLSSLLSAEIVTYFRTFVFGDTHGSTKSPWIAYLNSDGMMTVVGCSCGWSLSIFSAKSCAISFLSVFSHFLPAVLVTNMLLLHDMQGSADSEDRKLCTGRYQHRQTISLLLLFLFHGHSCPIDTLLSSTPRRVGLSVLVCQSSKFCVRYQFTGVSASICVSCMSH